jgi:FdhE protein
MIVTAEAFETGRAPGMGAVPTALVRPHASEILARRGERLATLGRNHPFGDFLGFVGGIVAAQRRQLAERRPWPQAAAAIAGEIAADAALPGAARTAALAVSHLAEAEIAAIAARWRDGSAEPADRPHLAFVLAGLQVELLQVELLQVECRQVESLAAAAAGSGRCPVCGGPPLVATISAHDGIHGVRHVHCALCASAWRVERLRCLACGSEGAVSYLGLEGDERAVKAEACGTCGHYLKTFEMADADGFEPLADDLATFDLDMRLAADGRHRVWPNPFLALG